MRSRPPAEPIDSSLCLEPRRRILGAIQPHGLLAIIHTDRLIVAGISENVATLLGLAAHDMCDKSLLAFIAEPDVTRIAAALSEPRRVALNPHDFTLCGSVGQSLAVRCTVQPVSGKHFLLECELQTGVDETSSAAAHSSIEQLALAPDIATLLRIAAHDIRAISGFDRVTIARFGPDWQPEIVAETTASERAPNTWRPPQQSSALDEQRRRWLLQSALSMVPDTHFVPASVVANAAYAFESPVDLTRATLRSVGGDEIEAFIAPGSRALLRLAIGSHGRLWGFITCEHRQPRSLGYPRRAACELVAHVLAWQLSTRLETAQRTRRARAESLQAQIATTIAGSTDLRSATIAAAPDILTLFAADRIVVRLEDRLWRSADAFSGDASLLAEAAQLNAAARNGVAACGQTLFIRLSSDGSDFVLVSRATPVAAPAASDADWTSDDLIAALAVRGTLHARLTARQRLPSSRSVDDEEPAFARRKREVTALIKLHDDIAVALPSRSAVVDLILAFACRETGADGALLESLDDADVVVQAAIGLAAATIDTRMPRSGSLSGISADTQTPLLCNDASRELDRTESAMYEGMGVASIVVVPIAISPTVKVILKMISAERGAFAEEHIQIMKLAGSNLVAALRGAQELNALAAAEKEQRTYARQLRALHAIASTTTSNRKDQIDAALALGLEQLDLDWAFLGLIDHSSQDIIIENSVSRDGRNIVDVGVRTPRAKTIFDATTANGVQIVQDVNDLVKRPAFPGWSSFIGVPLVIGGVQYGIIGFVSRDVRPQRFSKANTEFVAVAGELIASAVERGIQREQVETSEARYRALTDAIPEMVWVVDAANRFQYVNASWTSYTGLSLEQSAALGYNGIYDAAQLATVLARRNALPPQEHDCEVRLRRFDGAFRWHLMRSVPFQNRAGEWLVTATDIEERKSSEALMADVHGAALAATEAKSRFLATMSHEIRTPMNAVMGMTELLLLTQLSEEQREYIEIVRDSGQSLLRVLNDILDYSKIEAGKFELEMVQFDLPGQIASVVELLRAQFQIKGVRLKTRIDPNMPPLVSGDPGRLRQILLNLAGNALKFTPQGGEVQIGVDVRTAAGDAVPYHFTVEDTGIGIPPDVVKRLFQPFSQGDESTTRKYGGTGLGLSICAQLVALMNGTIGVRSVPDSGSTFWFEIELRPVNATVDAGRARKRGPTSSKPVVMRAEKILLVEDNEINTFLALKQLQRIGFIVSAVNNGQQAVEAVTREQFDLIFMDCHMPEMDGFAATREIRRLETGGARRLPIVAMTADARTEDHQNCLRAGMDDYVSKPTSLDSLRTVLDRWLPTPDRRLNNRYAGAPGGSPRTLALTTLLDLFGGDRSAVVTLLSAAAGSIRADFSRIENCAAINDVAAVAEAAHRLKGTSASIRATQLGEISTAVERAAQSANGSIPQALLAELRVAVEALIVEVEAQGRTLATIG